MPASNRQQWPNSSDDLLLIRCCRVYREAFDQHGDGVGRPLLTRLKARHSELNCLVLMLPPGGYCDAVLDDLEQAITALVASCCEPGTIEHMERSVAP